MWLLWIFSYKPSKFGHFWEKRSHFFPISIWLYQHYQLEQSVPIYNIYWPFVDEEASIWDKGRSLSSEIRFINKANLRHFRAADSMVLLIYVFHSLLYSLYWRWTDKLWIGIPAPSQINLNIYLAGSYNWFTNLRTPLQSYGPILWLLLGMLNRTPHASNTLPMRADFKG